MEQKRKASIEWYVEREHENDRIVYWCDLSNDIESIVSVSVDDNEAVIDCSI